MKISVAIASYNGEKYIKQQLDSILSQSIAVDEIVISDDGSTDKTVEMIQSFQDPRIRLITGNPYPGYCGNFAYAIENTTGDIIFISDQDDIWMEDKVEKYMAVFNTHSDIELIVSDGTLIDKDGNRIDDDQYNLNSIYTPHLSNRKSGKLLKSEFLAMSVTQTLSHGMRMCIRKSLRSSLFPFPQSHTIHDRWIGFCGLNKDAAYYLEDALVQYRLHDSNTTLRGNASLKKRWGKLLDGGYNVPFDLHNLACAMIDIIDNDPKALEAAIFLRDQNRIQIDILTGGRFLGIFAFIKLYRTSSDYRTNGIKFLFGQLFLHCFGRRYMKKHLRTAAKCNISVAE